MIGAREPSKLGVVVSAVEQCVEAGGRAMACWAHLQLNAVLSGRPLVVGVGPVHSPVRIQRRKS
jgi:hypothetical protein